MEGERGSADQKTSLLIVRITCGFSLLTALLDPSRSEYQQDTRGFQHTADFVCIVTDAGRNITFGVPHVAMGHGLYHHPLKR